jgi:excisionase family DNA binding protein
MKTDATTRLAALTPREVANILQVSRSSVYRAIADQRLVAIRLGPGGPLRITRAALSRFLTPVAGVAVRPQAGQAGTTVVSSGPARPGRSAEKTPT